MVRIEIVVNRLPQLKRFTFSNKNNNNVLRRGRASKRMWVPSGFQTDAQLCTPRRRPINIDVELGKVSCETNMSLYEVNGIMLSE